MGTLRDRRWLPLWGALVAAASCVPTLDRPPPGDSGPPGNGEGGLLDQRREDGPSCDGLSCPLGCNAALGRCNRLKPSNVDPAGFFALATGALALTTTDATIDTDTGEIKQGTAVIRPAGSKGSAAYGVYWDVVSQGADNPEVAVFAAASLDLAASAQVTVVGQHGLLLYLTTSASVAGTLRAPAKGASGGPGGLDGGAKNAAAGAACAGGEGQGGGTGPSIHDGDGGGGGGGHGAAGGNGADSTFPPTPKGGAGGATAGTETLVPLRGGCGGGAGGGPETGTPPGDGGYGGGGGGAIQIAVNGSLTVAGTIAAPGAGGEGGHYGAAAGGGGAGGAILLEAVKVSVSGTLAANGGGGGSGSAIFSAANAPAGQDGQPSAQPANGGGDNPPYGGAGGAGGAEATKAGTAAPADDNGGGGGGAAGRIRINAPSPEIGSATLSPKASLGSTVGTW